MINEQFQQILGRQPTQDEFQYLNRFISEGQLQPHEVGQFLQSMPEYQNTLLNQNTAQYGQQLNEQNKAILDQAGAAANSRFASLGRPNTSAMGASVLRAGGQLAQQRQSALADFYGRGLQQNMQNVYGQGQSALQRGYGLRDETRNRGYEIEDYYRQKNDAESARMGRSGWNAITPEFVASGLFKVGGAAAGGYAGGMAGGAGGVRPATPTGLR